MKSSSFEAGKLEATEQIVALIYERYFYFRTFFGKDSEQALSFKNLIHSIRDAQAQEMEQQNENE